ncbi:hypothetical protein FRB99_005142 [Tulasnella sp. 403]|nr:hypothetical protein FRB99_005142 [Tulasnella sp. 403]
MVQRSIWGYFGPIKFLVKFLAAGPADPDVGRAVLSTDFNNFEKGVKWNKMSYNFLGDGIFATDGAAWKFHRSVARPFFFQERISDTDLFKKHTDLLVQILNDRRTSSSPVDIQSLFKSLTLDITTDFLFGITTNSLTHGREAQKHGPSSRLQREFENAFDQLGQIVVKRVRIGASWYKYFEPFGDETRKPKQTTDAFLNPIVEQARLKHSRDRRTPGADSTGDEGRYTFLDHLIETSGTEEMANRIRSEIAEVVSDSSDVTMTHLKHLSYLRAFIDETLRLFSPVPFGIRRSRGRIFGVTMQKFSAQSDGLKAKVTQGGGQVHTCLSTQDQGLASFAYTLTSFILVQLLQIFDFELAEDAQPPDSLPPPTWRQPPQRIERKLIEKIWPKASFTLNIKGGLWVRVGSALSSRHS